MVNRKTCRKCWHWRRSGALGPFCGYHIDTGKCRLPQMTREQIESGECPFYEAGKPRKTIVRPFVVSPDPLASLAYGRLRATPGKLRYDEDKLLTMYDKGMNDAEIARELGCAKDTVFRWRKRMELPPNGNNSHYSIDWERIRALYEQGLNDSQIGKAVGVSHQTVCNWRSANKLPSNFRKEENK